MQMGSQSFSDFLLYCMISVCSSGTCITNATWYSVPTGVCTYDTVYTVRLTPAMSTCSVVSTGVFLIMTRLKGTLMHTPAPILYTHSDLVSGRILTYGRHGTSKWLVNLLEVGNLLFSKKEDYSSRTEVKSQELCNLVNNWYSYYSRTHKDKSQACNISCLSCANHTFLQQDLNLLISTIPINIPLYTTQQH